MDEKEVLNKAKEIRKKYYFNILAFSLSVGTIAIIITLLEVLMPLSIIITFPLIMIPFMTCTLFSTNRLINVGSFNYREYYSYYLPGLAPAMARKPLRPLITALKAFLIYYIIFAVSLSIFSMFPSIQPLTQELINNVSATDISQYTKLIYEFLSNEKVEMGVVIINIISFGAGFVYFFMSMINKHLYFLCKSLCMLPGGSKQPVFKEVFTKYKKAYYRNLLKFNWYSYFLMPLAYILGAVIIILTKPSNVSALEILQSSTIFGTILSLLIFIPLLPNHLIFNDVFSKELLPELREGNKQGIIDLVATLTKGVNQSDQSLEEMKKMLDQLNQQFNEKENEQNSIDLNTVIENKEDEKNETSKDEENK